MIGIMFRPVAPLFRTLNATVIIPNIPIDKTRNPQEPKSVKDKNRKTIIIAVSSTAPMP